MVGIREILEQPARSEGFKAQKKGLAFRTVAVYQAARDAVSELLSMVVGNICTKFSMRGYRAGTVPPKVVAWHEFSAMLAARPIVVRASLKGSELKLVFLLD